MKSLIYFCFFLAAGLSDKAIAIDKQASPFLGFRVLRVIYPQAERQGVTLTMYNESQSFFLVQSRIHLLDPATGEVDTAEPVSSMKARPFIVTPPLTRIEANRSLTLRIRRSDVPLPEDRESVFFVSMRALPKQPLALEAGKMAMTLLGEEQRQVSRSPAFRWCWVRMFMIVKTRSPGQTKQQISYTEKKIARIRRVDRKR